MTPRRPTGSTIDESASPRAAGAERLADFKVALDNSAIVAVTDVRGRITYANDKFCELSKYSREELIGRDHRLINSGRHPRSFFRELWSTILKGRVWRGEICNRAKDGSLYWVATTITPFLGSDGKPSQFLAIRHDITERKRVEEELRRARDAAVRREREQEAFLAYMSHEIRTPLSAVIALGESLARTPLDPRQSAVVDSMRRAGEGLLSILNEILDLAKIQAGRSRLVPADLDMGRELEAVVSLFEAKAREKKLEIALSAGEAVSLRLRADAGRLRQILSNLLSNAVKFTERGTIKVAVRVIKESGSSVSLRFEVIDTGPGIPLKDQRRLFEPFVQVVPGSASERGGTGLGLAISKRLAELMGGRLGLKTRPGAGSTFWLELRLPKAAAAEHSRGSRPPASVPARRAAAVPAADPKVKASRRAVVLIVEDDPTMRELLADAVVDWGHQALNAASVAEGEALAARREDIRLVLLDRRLPDGDGLRLCRALKADPRTRPLPVIVLTGLGEFEQELWTYHSGADLHLTKPLDLPALKRYAAAFLNRIPYRRDDARTLRCGALTLMPKAGKALVAGRPFEHIPRRLYDVLYHLAARQGRAVSSKALVQKLWGGSVRDSEAAVAVARLRRHLGPRLGPIVATRRGRGYFIDPAFTPAAG